MITKVEHHLAVNGNIIRDRVYHRAGNQTVDGVLQRDVKYAWTHPYSEKTTCVACTKNLIPPEVKATPARRRVTR